MFNYNKKLILQVLLHLIVIFCGLSLQAQKAALFIQNTSQSFYPSGTFIENKGQYGTNYKGQEGMGSILYGYEGHGMPILFTQRGLIFLQRKVEKLSHKAEGKLEKQGLSEDQIEQRRTVTDRVITMEWLGANKNVSIVQTGKSYEYHSYGLIQEKAYGYKKITYKNLYNGVDLVYSFTANNVGKIGFEYSFQVAAGADISQIQMVYGGDVKKLKINKLGKLTISSDIEGIEQSMPLSYYSNLNEDLSDSTQNSSRYKGLEQLKSNFIVTNNQVRFNIESYDITKSIIIDPFISSTNNLDGIFGGKAKDIDFDYAGNVYVSGGGDPNTNHRLAKYNSYGTLEWTFSGVLTSPVWEFGRIYGGWVVEKPTGKIYLGRGYTNFQGSSVIRLNVDGLYDNYIVTTNTDFLENWKMLWSCNNGTPQILVGGGGTTSNIHLGAITPTDMTATLINLTGIPFTASTGSNFGDPQDIVDFIIDPTENTMYSIFASGGVGVGGGASSVNNRIYKNTTPYSSSTLQWNTPSGLTSLIELYNRPYLSSPLDNSPIDNSANILAINTNYLFYWDGKFLKAFNKATGAAVGATLNITSNATKMSGGILADVNNNIYVGNVNGKVSSYKFNGSDFIANGPFGNPNLLGDIILSGYATKSVYDLAIFEGANLIYVCGDGFVASFPTNQFTPYNLNISTNCTTGSASCTILPTPPASTALLFTLYIDDIEIAINSTGFFTNLLPLTNYTIKVTLNEFCNSIKISKDFVIAKPSITTNSINEVCGNTQGQIIASASGTSAPYLYSLDGTNFLGTGTFYNLAANSYIVTVKDANGCINTKQVAVGNNTFTPTYSTAYNGTTCGNSLGTINADPNGGVAPYQYSINNGLAYQASNIFANLPVGQYQLKVKDANGCISTMVLVNISPSIGFVVSATSSNSTCNLSNGTIIVNSIGGVSPFLYSINGGINYQVSNIFTGLLPGNYTITMKDANNCVNISSNIVVSNTLGAIVTAISNNSTCGKNNGKIVATASGGISDYQYSIDGGISYQSGNIFPNLAPSNYIVYIKDGNSCINTCAISVNALPIPVLQVYAGQDTTASINELLQLNAIDINNTGFVNYSWSPFTGLNNPNIKAPVATLDKDVTYYLSATTADGCMATDTLKIKISLRPSIYVPSAFTPNGDGKNDILKPKLIGIKKLSYFSVFNRYGELVYTTKSKNEGWDGLVKSAIQNTGTYVWIAEGMDFTGQIIYAKGTSILIQ